MAECNTATQGASDAAASEQDARLARARRLFIIVALSMILIAGAAVLIFMSGVHPYRTRLTQIYFFTQDSWLLMTWGAALLLLPALSKLVCKVSLPALNARNLAGAGAALFLACYAGHYLLLGGANLSADEQRADFDADIFSHGKLFWPLPETWRAEPEVLNFTFILPVAENKAWVSAYLPGNAGLRALVGSVADPALTSPLLVLLGAFALFRICRRLWPGDNEAAVVALALYALSGQILFNGMTAYAMSAHLALNLVWLWLFLMNRPAADVGALAVGFVATGLHQPVFHPLFAIAFLTPLLLEKKFARAAFYATGYALVIGFWLSWPSMIQDLAAGGAMTAESANYAERFSKLNLSVTAADIETMLMNIVRFVTWQHVLFAPLVALGATMAALKSSSPYARPLFAALVLPIITVLILLPYQGHGWGFRYVHGALGAAVLLAVYGWKSLDLAPARRGGVLVAASALTAFVFIPIQAGFIGGTYRAFAAIDRMIDSSDADYVVVDNYSALYTQDLVYNSPDLSNRPLRLLGTRLSVDLIEMICAGQPTIAFIGEEETAPFQRIYHLGRLSDKDLAEEAYVSALDAGCVAG